MVLSGHCSNPALKDLLQCLTGQGLDQESARAKALSARSAGWTDGRRKFGSVSNAVITVLVEADSDMQIRTIHAEVERLLGGSVSRHSVSDYLRTRSKGSKPLFVRTRYGHYQLLRLS